MIDSFRAVKADQAPHLPHRDKHKCSRMNPISLRRLASAGHLTPLSFYPNARKHDRHDTFLTMRNDRYYDFSSDDDLDEYSVTNPKSLKRSPNRTPYYPALVLLA